MPELGAADAVLYLSVIFMVYVFMVDIFKESSYESWIKWFFFGVLILLLVWALWSYFGGKKQDDREQLKDPRNNDAAFVENHRKDDVSEDDDVSETVELKEKGETEIPENFSLKPHRFAVSSKPAASENGLITYEYFKRWYLSPEFLKKFTESQKQALKIKRKRLIAVRNQYQQDLETIRSKEPPKTGLQALLADRGDDVRLLEGTIAEIRKLLSQIREKEKKVSLDESRKALVSALTDPKHGIDSLTGRQPIKDFLALQLYTFAQNPRTFFSGFQNMAIYGPSGVGKTKLAEVVGHVYAVSGILTRNHVHIITKQSLTTAYVNESGRITRKLLLSNLEGVVFIDEAYDLSPPDNGFGRSIDHGYEAITEMVNFMDKMIGLGVIIVAGYQKEMETRFMSANEGLPRRFPHKLILTPYHAKELTNLCVKFLLAICPEIRVPQDRADYLYTLIDNLNRRDPEIFSKQAGDMSNLSGCLSRAIYGTPGKTWANNPEEIILSGMNSYLSGKGLTISIK